MVCALVQEGARMQLNKGQLTCGVEMAMVLVEVGDLNLLLVGIK
jgi:hypothetical protein